MKIKVWVCTNKVGSKSVREIEINDDEWNEMEESEKDDICMETMNEMIEWGYKTLS